MKNLLLILVALGGLISTTDAQTFRKDRPTTYICNTSATVTYASRVPEGWDFKVSVKPTSLANIRFIELYIDTKYIGRLSSPYYQWQLNTDKLHLTPGQHRIRVIVASECGNTRQILKYFKVDKLR